MSKSLRERIGSGELLIGTFIKTPAPQIVEILGESGLDFAVIDQEHAPIDLAHLDLMALASRAVDMPLLSRRWGRTSDWISPVLDVGLTGVMIPHVYNHGIADNVCDAAKFARGKRGLSPSPRAGRYGGLSLNEFKKQSDEQSVIALQIEDEQALAQLDEIASINEVDLLFVGPTDLAQSMNVSVKSSKMENAIKRVIEACMRNGRAAGLFVSNEQQIQYWQEYGVTFFVVGSDQSMLRQNTSRIMQFRTK